MAFRMRKIDSITSSSYSISAIIAANNKNKCLTLFAANNPLLQTWIRSQFCTEQAIPKPQVDTPKFGKITVPLVQCFWIAILVF